MKLLIMICFFYSNSKMCGDKVAVLSKFGGTVSKLPSYLQEFPMFPGIGNYQISKHEQMTFVHVNKCSIKLLLNSH